MDFTKKVLRESDIYKKWVGNDRALIHNIYEDDVAPTYVVLHISSEGKWKLTRFFTIKDDIHVSVDYVDLLAEEAIKLLIYMEPVLKNNI